MYVGYGISRTNEILLVPVKNFVISIKLIHSMQQILLENLGQKKTLFPRELFLALHFCRQFFATVAAFQHFAVDIPVTV